MTDSITAQPDNTANQNAVQGSDKLGVLINIITTLLAATSMGMLAVLVPVHLASFEYSDSIIGVALSFETIASLALCLGLPNILRKLGLSVGLLLSTFIRVPTVLIFPFFSDLNTLVPVIFLHYTGCYSLLLLLQIWVNSIPFQKNKGLMIALYSTSISVGLAIGPIIINFLAENKDFLANITGPTLAYLTDFFGKNAITTSGPDFVVAALISAISSVPLLLYLPKIPSVKYSGGTKIIKTIFANKGAMFSISMAGVSQFGVAAFITIYGMKNGLTLQDSALLLTCFMLGSLILEVPIAWLSDHFDRRYLIVWCAFASMFCAVYLPIAIYTPIQAWVLVFIWGGVIAGIYSVSLALIGDRYTDNDGVIASNAGYSLMESIGGTLGIIAIGSAMQVFGTDGLPYIIMFASVLYFSFALTRYPVE